MSFVDCGLLADGLRGWSLRGDVLTVWSQMVQVGTCQLVELLSAPVWHLVELTLQKRDSPRQRVPGRRSLFARGGCCRPGSGTVPIIMDELAES